MNKEIKITFSIAGIIIVGLVLLMAFTPKAPLTSALADPEFLVATKSHMTGIKGAKVTVVEFGDYQCPACGFAETILTEVRAYYAKNPDVNFVFRHFPLTSIHDNALITAEAAEAASAQGKFWEMHALLYENQNAWAEISNPIDLLVSYAKEIGIDTTKFKKEVENKKYQNNILADQSDGNTLNIDRTPTFFINGEMQPQIPTFSEFKSKIDALLKK